MTHINLTIGEQPLSLEPLIGSRTAVLGESGGGKTNTVAVLAEELAPHIPMTIIDPEGEMYTLREKINCVVVGRSENVDIEIQPHQAAEIARWSVENRVTVILDLFDYDGDEVEQLATDYAYALFDACKRAKPRLPYHVIIEEAHIFIPQPSTLKSPWKQVALRGRKYGLGTILASQRSQMVDKDVLTQSAIKILHQVSHPRDVSVYKDLIPLDSKRVEKTVYGLHTGQAVLVYRDGGTKSPTVQIRLRDTHHAGATPTLTGMIEEPTAAGLDNSQHVMALEALIEASAQPVVDPEIAKRDKRIKELEEQNQILDSLVKDQQKMLEQYTAAIQRLNDRIETLRMIQVQVQLVSTDGQPITVATTEKAPTSKQKPAVFQKDLFSSNGTHKPVSLNPTG